MPGCVWAVRSWARAIGSAPSMGESVELVTVPMGRDWGGWGCWGVLGVGPAGVGVGIRADGRTRRVGVDGRAFFGQPVLGTRGRT
ncbi:MAG: hypothetical protein KatS3mg103_0295 [Phycisphaerales bacterium]|nr:MAG: hypothetical protein KatS3mg103_0295 [Phycisphaerales bacterium]